MEDFLTHHRQPPRPHGRQYAQTLPGGQVITDRKQKPASRGQWRLELRKNAGNWQFRVPFGGIITGLYTGTQLTEVSTNWNTLGNQAADNTVYLTVTYTSYSSTTVYNGTDSNGDTDTNRIHLYHPNSYALSSNSSAPSPSSTQLVYGFGTLTYDSGGDSFSVTKNYFEGGSITLPSTALFLPTFYSAPAVRNLLA